MKKIICLLLALVMTVGMLGIFVVMGVIILAVYGLGALNAKRRKNSKKQQ